MVNVIMPKGTNFDDTKDTSDKIIKQISRINGVETVGASISGGMFGGFGPGAGNANKNSVSIYIVLDENKSYSSAEITELIREKTTDFEAEINVNDTGMDMSALSGGDITVNIRGRELDVLGKIARDIAKIIDGVEGTIEVSDGLEETTPELRIKVNKEKSNH